jgi:hypothetical protein
MERLKLLQQGKQKKEKKGFIIGSSMQGRIYLHFKLKFHLFDCKTHAIILLCDADT